MFKHCPLSFLRTARLSRSGTAPGHFQALLHCLEPALRCGHIQALFRVIFRHCSTILDRHFPVVIFRHCSRFFSGTAALSRTGTSLWSYSGTAPGPFQALLHCLELALPCGHIQALLRSYSGTAPVIFRHCSTVLNRHFPMVIVRHCTTVLIRHFPAVIFRQCFKVWLRNCSPELFRHCSRVLLGHFSPVFFHHFFMVLFRRWLLALFRHFSMLLSRHCFTFWSRHHTMVLSGTAL